MTDIASVSLAQPLETIADELGRSFAEYGFAVVRDHGIPQDLIDEKGVACAVERMETDQIGVAERADERAHLVRILDTERRVIEQRLHASERVGQAR